MHVGTHPHRRRLLAGAVLLSSLCAVRLTAGSVPARMSRVSLAGP